MSDYLQNIWHKIHGESGSVMPLDINLLVGKNASNNWEIYKLSNLGLGSVAENTSQVNPARGNQIDTIFHLDKFPSPYVIINKPIEELSTELIIFAATVCKSKSKYKNVPNIGVLYTPISNTIIGDKVGSFIIVSNRKKHVIHI